MKALKCVYCGGLVVRSPEGEYVCSVCGSVQPSGVVEGVRGALSRRFDGASIEEYELPRDYVKRHVEAAKAWLREQYVRAVVEVEEAHYGWMWFYSLMRQRGPLAEYVRSMRMERLIELILAVHKIVSSCSIEYPISEERLKNILRRLGFRIRYGDFDKRELYMFSDYAVLKDSLTIINTLKRIHCEKKCGACGKQRDHTPRTAKAPPRDGGSPPSTAQD